MNRRRFCVESGKVAVGLAGLVLGLAGSTGCATTEPEKKKPDYAEQVKRSKYAAQVWIPPPQEARDVAALVENYGTLSEGPGGFKNYSLDIAATFPTGETRTYSINVFYEGQSTKLQFNVESTPKGGPHLKRSYHDTGIDGTLDTVTDGFASMPPGKSTFAFINVEKRQITLTEVDDVKGRKVSQKPLDGESMRSLYDGYRDDLKIFLKLYAPKNSPSFPIGKGIIAML